jgi:hypothetical protein
MACRRTGLCRGVRCVAGTVGSPPPRSNASQSPCQTPLDAIPLYAQYPDRLWPPTHRGSVVVGSSRSSRHTALVDVEVNEPNHPRVGTSLREGSGCTMNEMSRGEMIRRLDEASTTCTTSWLTGRSPPRATRIDRKPVQAPADRRQRTSGPRRPRRGESAPATRPNIHLASFGLAIQADDGSRTRDLRLGKPRLIGLAEPFTGCLRHPLRHRRVDRVQVGDEHAQ